MTEPELNTRLQTITPPDEAARAAAHAPLAALAKPAWRAGPAWKPHAGGRRRPDRHPGAWILPAVAVLVLCSR